MRRVALGAGLVAAGALGVGWAIARRLTAPSTRRYDLIVRDVEYDGDACLIVLDRTRQTAAEGAYNLWFENGGWAQLSEDVLDRGPTLIARRVTSTASGLTLRAGDHVSWSGIYYATPHDASLHAHDITVDTPAGPAPAWRIDGDGARSTWAIHLHGLGSVRAGTLRGVLAATERGYTSLVITYRADGEGSGVGNGRATLGFTEADDAAAAIEYAMRHGARQVVLFGCSMGAAIALQLAHHPSHRRSIAGLVLDSPVLDWTEVIKANCTRSGLPAAAGSLAIPWLTLRPLARMAGLPERIPIRSFDWMVRAEELTAPTLILHGTRDDSVPVRLSQALRDARPDLVSLEVFEAGHTLSWNSDRGRWQYAVTEWLTGRITA
ncbi:alpha/beta hydrolase [Microbacterium enclense]|nr:alpha/beta fold hydrolase [Microbacterium enclense]